MKRSFRHTAALWLMTLAAFAVSPQAEAALVGQAQDTDGLGVDGSTSKYSAETSASGKPANILNGSGNNLQIKGAPSLPHKGLLDYQRQQVNSLSALTTWSDIPRPGLFPMSAAQAKAAAELAPDVNPLITMKFLAGFPIAASFSSAKNFGCGGCTEVSVSPLLAPKGVTILAAFPAEDPIAFTDPSPKPFASPPGQQSLSGSRVQDGRAALSQGGINPATGNNTQVDTDFVGAPQTQLKLTRTYNSYDTAATSFGVGWHGTWDRSVHVLRPDLVRVTREDGRADAYQKSGDQWKAARDVTSVLSETVVNGVRTGWLLICADSSKETYNVDGQLTTVTTRSGLMTQLVYDGPNLVEVVGPFGQKLTFTYDPSNRVASMTTPSGDVFVYAYTGNNNLIGVAYPDKSQRTYAYRNAVYPHLLTGIYDAGYNLSMIFDYDGFGRAVQRQYAGGINRVAVLYNEAGALVTDMTGRARTYVFDVQFDLLKLVKRSGDLSDNGETYAYNDDGFLETVTDAIGNVTHYERNSLGEEVARTEGARSKTPLTVTTEWSPDFRRPLLIREPGRETAFDLDGSGNLVRRSVKTDGDTRQWAFSYNAEGLMVSETDPAGQRAAYDYDSLGNVTRLTDATGHTTVFLKYDDNGYLLKSVDPYGTLTALTYDKRGRSVKRRIGASEISYQYNADGDLYKVTLPNASQLTYSFDKAHRLTKLADSFGNFKLFTLDDAGNCMAVQKFAANGEGGSLLKATVTR